MRPNMEVASCAGLDDDDAVVVCSTEAFNAFADRLKARRLAVISRGPAVVDVLRKPNIVSKAAQRSCCSDDGFVSRKNNENSTDV